MNWCDERFVKVYTRDTGDWVRLGWEAQALFLLLLRKVDRVGIIDLGKAGTEGLADLLRMPLGVVEPALDRLLKDGCVTRSHATSQLVVTNYVEAQAAAQSDKQRQHESRARRRAAAKAAASHNTGHAASHGVTPGHSDTDADSVTDSIPPTPRGGVTPEPEPPPPTEPPGWMAAGSTSPTGQRRREPPAYPQRPGAYVPGSPPRVGCTWCGRRDGPLTAYRTPAELLCAGCLERARANERPHTVEARPAADALAAYRARLGAGAGAALAGSSTSTTPTESPPKED